MTFFENTKASCDELADMMAERGMVTPTVELHVRSHTARAVILVNFGAVAGLYCADYKVFTGDTPTEALEKAKAWVLDRPTAQESARNNALALTAKALEASRAAGFDTAEGIAFVAQLEAMMKRLSENAITDQSEAA